MKTVGECEHCDELTDESYQDYWTLKLHFRCERCNDQAAERRANDYDQPSGKEVYEKAWAEHQETHRR